MLPRLPYVHKAFASVKRGMAAEEAAWIMHDPPVLDSRLLFVAVESAGSGWRMTE